MKVQVPVLLFHLKSLFLHHRNLLKQVFSQQFLSFRLVKLLIVRYDVRSRSSPLQRSFSPNIIRKGSSAPTIDAKTAVYTNSGRARCFPFTYQAKSIFFGTKNWYSIGF